MTIKDIPRSLYTEVETLWYGEEFQNLRPDGGTPRNRVADREGLTNPDEETTRWEWDTDLTTEEENTFDLVVRSAQNGIDMTRYTAMSGDIAFLRAVALDAEKPEFERRVSRVILSMLRDD